MCSGRFRFSGNQSDSMSNEPDELTRLRAEVTRLIALLESHGIDWGLPPAPTTASAPPPEPSNLSTAEKVALFRRLFRGRTDVHPVRWESATTGKSGYAPARTNEWRPGLCEKPRINCADCGNRALVPVSDAVIYSHLAGEKTIGIYPLLPDDTCYFLAVDFDKAEWREDAKAFVQSCHELDERAPSMYARLASTKSFQRSSRARRPSGTGVGNVHTSAQFGAQDRRR